MNQRRVAGSIIAAIGVLLGLPWLVADVDTPILATLISRSSPGDGSVITGTGGTGMTVRAWTAARSFRDVNGQTPDSRGDHPTVDFSETRDAIEDASRMAPTDGRSSAFRNFFATRFTAQVNTTPPAATPTSAEAGVAAPDVGTVITGT